MNVLKKLLLAATVPLCLLFSLCHGEEQGQHKIDPGMFVSTGRSKYFILEAGYMCKYEGKKGRSLTITVLDETKLVDGVETRIVEEREALDGEPTEVSRDYFAFDKSTNDVYCFGEDVDNYKNGKLRGHGGSWHSGVNGAKYGLMMSGDPKVGMRYYQEQVPEVAMDKAEIISLNEKLNTKAGKFENCLVIDVTSEVDHDTDHKIFAPGIGLIANNELKLVKVEKSSAK